MSLVLALAPWGTQDHFMHPSLLMLNQIDVHIDYYSKSAIW